MSKNYRKIIRKVARNNGVTVAEVESEIKKAIDMAYGEPSFMARCVPKSGGVPTAGELMEYIARRAIITSE